MLPGLGGTIFSGLIETSFAKLEVLVCAECGMTRFFTEPGARAKLPNVRQWTRI